MASEKRLNKQEEILSFLKQEILTKGFPPSVREICAAVGLKSPASVHGYLADLEASGRIRRDPDKQRAIEILDPDFQDLRVARLAPAYSGDDKAGEVVSVPIVGRVAAGVPLLAVEQIDGYFPIPVDRLPNAQTFFLEVRGDSMIEAGIFDRDYVLVEQTSTARDGEMVVALIEDSATVKTFYREADHIRLQPENSQMEPIIVRGDLQILGRVIGSIRFF